MKKAEIRKRYIEKRNSLTEEDVSKKSTAIAHRFFSEINLNEIKILHVFISIAKFKEVNTWSIIHRIWKEYPHIQIATSITKKEKLIHTLIDSNTTFKEDKWGIPTPQNINIIDPKKIDIIITPLLAFDAQLQRVGYGKGYYDKFFSECSPNVKKIGVSLFPMLENNIEDTNEYDIKLDKVIT